MVTHFIRILRISSVACLLGIVVAACTPSETPDATPKAPPANKDAAGSETTKSTAAESPTTPAAEPAEPVPAPVPVAKEWRELLLNGEFAQWNGKRPTHWLLYSEKQVSKADEKDDKASTIALTSGSEKNTSIAQAIGGDLAGLDAVAELRTSEAVDGLRAAVTFDVAGKKQWTYLHQDRQKPTQYRVKFNVPKDAAAGSGQFRVIYEGKPKSEAVIDSASFQVQVPADAVAGEILTNGSFETWEKSKPAGWTVYASKRVKKKTEGMDDSPALTLSPSKTDHTTVAQYLPDGIAGKDVILTLYVDDFDKSAHALAFSYQGADDKKAFVYGQQIGKGDWDMLQIRASVPADIKPKSASFRFDLRPGAEESVSIDGASMVVLPSSK